MKLDFPSIPIETSANFKTSSFGFGDSRIIMNILRSKMYSRPVFIICQEVMSNSRDANREVGRGHIPIEVVLPSRMDPQIHFKDCGPGISPDRMETVFIRYGQSTKRADNNQVGGFGLGAKTPFAYSDSFTITTVSEQNGKRFKRQYIAYIDETQIGAMSQISEAETDEQTGTTITVGVDPKDIDEFINSVVFVSQYWTPRPKLTGNEAKYPDIAPVIESSKGTWRIADGGESIAIIDGIQYKLDKNAIRGQNIRNNSYGYSRYNSSDIIDSPIQLIFNTGDLLITANREALDYQPDVIAKIKGRLDEAKDELAVLIADELKQCTTLWEASHKWNELRNVKQFSNLVDPKWNGQALLGDRIDLAAPYIQKGQFNIGEHYKVFKFSSDSSGLRPVLGRWRRETVNVSKRTILVENDIAGQIRPNRMRLETLRQKHPDMSEIVVVSTNFAPIPAGQTSVQDHLEKIVHWSQLGVVKLSAYEKAKMPKTPGTGATYTVIPVKKLERESSRKGTYYHFNASEETLDGVGGGLYVILKDGKPQFKGAPVEPEQIWKAHQALGITDPVYGILIKYKKRIGAKWKLLENTIDEEVKKLKDDTDVKSYVELNGDNSAHYHLDEVFESIKTSVDAGEIPSESSFASWVSASAKCSVAKEKVDKLNAILLEMKDEQVKIDSVKITAKRKEIFNKYPLISQKFNSRYDNVISQEDYKNAVVKYVNLIDKEVQNVNSN